MQKDTPAEKANKKLREFTKRYLDRWLDVYIDKAPKLKVLDKEFILLNETWGSQLYNDADASDAAIARSAPLLVIAKPGSMQSSMKPRRTSKDGIVSGNGISGCKENIKYNRSLYLIGLYGQSDRDLK